MKIIMKRTASDDMYRSDCGLALQREYNTRTPNGNLMNGRWVLRNADKVFVDFDQYINDITERHNLELEY